MSEWVPNPGYCPVAPNVLVEVKFGTGVIADYEDAGDWYWGKTLTNHDITHYRVKDDKDE